MLGLGNIGGAVARIGKAFGMEVIAWSQNLTAERAAEAGAALVTKEELFRRADILTIHLVLSRRTRGLVGAEELALMKPTARLVNTSRGPIVVEADLIAALAERQDRRRRARRLRPGAAAARSPVSHSAESAGHTAYRLRLARSLSALLPGHGRQYPAMARPPGTGGDRPVDRSRRHGGHDGGAARRGIRGRGRRAPPRLAVPVREARRVRIPPSPWPMAMPA